MTLEVLKCMCNRLVAGNVDILLSVTSMIRNSHNNGLKVHTWLQDDILKETSRLTPSDTSCGESDPSDITTLISKTHIGTDEAKTGRHQDESTPSPDPVTKDEEAILK